MSGLSPEFLPIYLHSVELRHEVNINLAAIERCEREVTILVLIRKVMGLIFTDGCLFNDASSTETIQR
jgi:hypothetical protein